MVAVAPPCGSADTLLLEVKLNVLSVPWTVVGTPGANFIQSQFIWKYPGRVTTILPDWLYHAIRVLVEQELELTGQSSASETRRLTMTNWMNTNPSSTISSLPLAERTSGTVWLPTSAQLRILDDGVGNGTGAGADELRLTMIGEMMVHVLHGKLLQRISLDVSGAYRSHFWSQWYEDRSIIQPAAIRYSKCDGKQRL